MCRDLVDGSHEAGRHRTARLMLANQLIAGQKQRFKRATDSESAQPAATSREGLGRGRCLQKRLT